ncbi:MAG TPA: hypothetical protein VK466_10995 [Terriglobales bacterium]|nr:hypothetical protein [Terriglobales bacterium]
MSEEQFATHNPGASFEKEDLDPLGVLYFMAGLAVVGVVIYFIVVGMYKYLDAYDRTHQAPVSPMATKTGIDPATMNYNEIREKAEESFPAPVLEYNERLQFAGEVAKQDQVLGSYDWVDKNNGLVRIPIDRAIDILAQRGLPVIPADAAGKAAAAAKTPAAPAAGVAKAKPEGKSQ